MPTSATPSPIYSLPPARIPVPATFATPSESTPSPQSRSRDAPSCNTQTPTSEPRVYTPRAALYTPDAPHMGTMRLQSLTPPTTLAAFLSTPSPARRLGVFTPSRAETRSRSVNADGGGGHEGRIALGEGDHVLNDNGDAQEVFGGATSDYDEPLGGNSDIDSVASGRLGTVAEGLSDREDEDEDMRAYENDAAPAVSPQADHPTLQRGQSQAPEGDLSMADYNSSDASSGTIAEGLNDEERVVEDYLMQSDDAYDPTQS